MKEAVTFERILFDLDLRLTNMVEVRFGTTEERAKFYNFIKENKHHITRNLSVYVNTPKSMVLYRGNYFDGVIGGTRRVYFQLGSNNFKEEK